MFFFFKQKTAYEMRISDWSSDVCSSDLIDPEHTTAVFMVNHLGYSNMIGRFNEVSGSFTFDENAPEAASVTLKVATDSVDTNHQRRDDHLRSPDFFNVQEFPEMTFESTKVETTGDRTGRVTGDLTLLGVTRPVTLDVTFNKVAPHPLPPYDEVLTAGFSVRGSIRRSEFGMKYALPTTVADEEIVRASWRAEGCTDVYIQSVGSAIKKRKIQIENKI